MEAEARRAESHRRLDGNALGVHAVLVKGEDVAPQQQGQHGRDDEHRKIAPYTVPLPVRERHVSAFAQDRVALEPAVGDESVRIRPEERVSVDAVHADEDR